MASRRKCPFSGKAKKEQLKEKKIKNQHRKFMGKKTNVPLLRKSVGSSDADDDEEDTMEKSIKLNVQYRKNDGRNSSRYALQFYKDSKAEIEQRKKAAQETLKEVPKESLEIDFQAYFPSAMNFPRRPPWNYKMSREELEARENRYFTNFVSQLEKQCGSKNLSYFELNLETWRQLWRVLEMSDIVLIVVDIRYAALMFPPSVYKFVCDDMKKDMILVLNKVDIVTADLIVAWKHYFLKHYPTIKIITFTSYPGYNLRNVASKKSGLQVRNRRGKLKMAIEGAQKLYEVCKEITKGEVDLSSWSDKIFEEMNSLNNCNQDDSELEPVKIINEPIDTGFKEHVKYKEGTLTIGCIGQPNVGKSSLINALMGKKVVSVSRTPGHTKHFQTIYLTQNVILCDCPGLVFPSNIPRTLQILIGAYPIAQVREPYTAVKYLAERLNLPMLLGIQHPENDDTWSAIDICDGWAKKRGFLTAKTARPDTYRAANSILRMALEGKICLSFKPPEYFAKQEFWLNHREVVEVARIQAKDKIQNNNESESGSMNSSDEESQKGGHLESDNEGKNDEDLEDSGSTQVANRFALLEEMED